MKFRTLKYHIKQGISGLFKNRLMSLAAIVTVMACVCILIISLCVVENINYIIEQFESRIGISVFIKDEVSDKDVSYIEQQLKSISHVQEVKYVSKEEALEKSKERWKDKTFWKGLEKDNPLPKSFDIVIDSSENQRAVIADVEKIQKNFEESIVSKNVEKDFKEKNKISENTSEAVSEDLPESNTEVLKDKDGISIDEYKNAEISSIGSETYEYKGIYKIQAAQTAADSLATIKNTIRIISFVLILVMGIIAMGIIINTIKLTVFVRKNEINIMKYVGATDKFIRGPFIVEGFLIGIIGAIIPCIISWLFYDEIINVMYNEFSLLKRLFEFKQGSDIFTFIIPMSLIFGAGLGVLGSITSVKKHLNV